MKFAAVVSQVNLEGHPSHLAQLLPDLGLNLPTKPESNRRKRGLIEPKEQAIPPPRVNSQARSNAGLTVIGVTLVVMVFYGRAAAVVGLCACFCLAAILRRPAVAEVTAGEIVGARQDEVTSEEHKKRVVLEGLLDRSKQRVHARVEKV